MDFLSGSGIGNEIAFYIFDYPPEQELQVRDHLQGVLPGAHPQEQGLDLRVASRESVRPCAGLSEGHGTSWIRPSRCRRRRGTKLSRSALRPPFTNQKLGAVFAEVVRPEQQDLILVSGVGSVWPLLRSHTLLSNLHSVMGKTPLVMFYPGRYDGQSLRLFGKLRNNNYYRAFKLIP